MTRLAHHDARTLFERAWSYGVESGIIDADTRERVVQEGARAIRKIANVLGTEHLRGDLERAMRSMLGLAELHLERISGGDVRAAARSIAANGLLFHTRNASRAIKQVLATEDGLDPDHLAPEDVQRYEEQVVTAGAQYSLEELLELERGAARVRAARAAARGIVHALGGEVDADDADPEALVLTGLLVLAYRRDKTWIGDVPAFEKLLASIRKSPARLGKPPKGIPEAHRAIAEEIWTARVAKIRELVVESGIAVHVLAAGNPEVNPLHGHLALPGDALEDVDAHGVATTAHWQKLTRGATDEERLLVIMLRGVLDFAEKVPFSLAAAARLLDGPLARRPEDRLIDLWLSANVPHQRQSDLRALWDDFWDERETWSPGELSGEDLREFCEAWFPMRAPRGG